ncbi:hypothetical protein D0466_04215 [Peribacillus glennii]|uniref:Alpha/beta hydrolase domain-containing protein n=1 Tax=Peribacillus glennii TaxID=2303991 RepID=A0A372LFQ0_9BACI|nr:hypothetical protein D0466_04215 [Peribacillus glennii]
MAKRHKRVQFGRHVDGILRAFPSQGYAYVGVSVQRVGFTGWEQLGELATGLRKRSPERYGSLDVTDGGTINDDSFSFDI